MASGRTGGGLPAGRVCSMAANTADHGLASAAAPAELIPADARGLIQRITRGIPRLISHLLRIALTLSSVDAAAGQQIAQPTQPPVSTSRS